MGQAKKGSKLIYAWWANLSVNLPIIATVTGLLYAIILLYPTGSNHQFTYHQLQIKNKRELVEKVINNRIIQLNNSLEEIKLRNINTTDSIRQIQNHVRQALTELNRLRFFNSDTSLAYFTKYFSADRDIFNQAISNFSNSSRIKEIPASLFDTCSYVSDSAFIGSSKLVIEKKSSGLMEWIGNNSSFGMWFFFSVAQVSLWFLLAVLIIGIVRNVSDIIPELHYEIKKIFFFSLLPLAVITIFSWPLYDKLIDQFLIKDAYFMEGFNTKMIWYSVPGYLVAIICFSCYLFLSNKLELLNMDAQSKNISISTNDRLQNDYRKLKSSFNNSFLCSAIVLTVFVVWVGILFNSVNNMEVMRFYTLLSGYPFLNYDNVYLLGIMHTLLLLIFYVPVRLRFNLLQIKQETDDKKSDSSGNNKKYLSAV
jgi:hypothetical protein